MVRLTAQQKKNILFLVPLVVLLISTLIFYIVVVRVIPNDKILTTSDGVALFSNENPTFNVEFGDKNDPDRQWVRFEAEASAKSPFVSGRKNIFTQIAEIFSPSKKSGIEMSLRGVDFSETEEASGIAYDQEVQTVADLLGTEEIKTSTVLAETGREIGKSDDDQTISKQTIINQGVADGIDLEYQILTGLGLKEEIVINDLEAYRNSCDKGCKLPLNEFVFDLKMDEGVSLKKGWYTVEGKSTETYYFVDSRGKYLAHFLPNYAMDGSGVKTYNVDLEVSEKSTGNYEVKVTVASDWLLDENRLYPIRIDPSIVHDDTADFNGGIFNRIESKTGPKIQLTTAPDCTGGTITQSGNYKIHTFTSSGTLSCASYGTAEILVVGGGGAGQGGHSTQIGVGGGGAGGVIYDSDFTISQGNISVTVGGGGTAGGANSGANSVFSSLTAVGGGYGSPWSGGAGSGGSGGGNTGNAGAGGSGTSGQGYAGGQGSGIIGTTTCSGGGGGGAGSVGQNGSSNTIGGSGGSGIINSISGSPVTYAVGGLGGNSSGGGTAPSGAANSGNGGGGGKGSSGAGGSGGSGIVIVKYINTISGEYISSSMDMGGSISGATLSWTPSGVNTGNGETPYSTTGLLAQWDFNETSGTTADNEGSCGATCDGTLTNFASTGSQDAANGTGWTSVNKRWGGALMFDGSDDYVSVGDLSQLEPSSVSVAAWVKIISPQVGVYRKIAGKFSSAASQGYQIAINGLNGGGPYFQIGNGTSTPASSSPDYSVFDGEWHHIVGTYDGTNLKIYVDGIERDSDTSSAISYGSEAFTISGSSSLSSVIDSVTVYSRALTASEVLSNYQAGNIEFQYRVSADNSTWSDWTSYGTSASDLAWDSMDDQDRIIDSGYYNSKSLVATSGVVDYGGGADGACSVSSGTVNINTASCSSRGTADAVNFSSTVLTSEGSTSITVATTPTGLTAGDEILIINMQGTNFTNVGLYETHIISSIATNTLSFTDYPTKYKYDGTTETIMVQRVPNYTSVTVSSGAIMTANAWNGTKGGVLFFRASGTVTDGGTISMDAKGYAGGAGSTTNATGGYAGDSICLIPLSGSGGYGAARTGYSGTCGGGGGAGATSGGLTGTGGSGSTVYGGSGGGGGSGTNLGGNGGGGGGGGYGTNGIYGQGLVAGGAQNGTSGGIDVSGNGGNSASSGNYSYEGGAGGGGSYGFGNLFRIYLGSGGGGGGSLFGGNGNYNGGAGGGGGGIIMISANTITISASSYITSDGVNGSAGASGAVGFGGSGGGGAGGSISLVANTISVGTSLVGAIGGTGNTTNNDGGNGGSGRIAIFYTTSMSGTVTTPNPFVQKYQSLTKVEGTGSMQLNSGSYTADSNTVALWHLDERGGSGAYIKDSSGSGLHGTPTGTVYSNSGKVGGARYYDTGTTSIEIANPVPSALNFTTTAFTVEAWVNIDGYSAARYITSCDNGSVGWGFSVNTSGQLRLTTRGTTDNETVGTTVLSTGQWYHVAAVFTGTGGQRRLYINGNLEASENYTGSITTSTIAFTLGSRSTTYYRGFLDEIRISNIARTADEISESYKLGANKYISKTVPERDLSSINTLPIYVAGDRPGSYLNVIWGESGYFNSQTDSNTVALWHLDEITGGGAYLKDYSGINGHATPSGTTYTSSGKLGGARSFNGTSDYISTTATGVSGTTSRTFEAWIKTSSTAAQVIVDWGGSLTAGQRFKVYVEATTGVIYVSNNTGYVKGTKAVNDGSWHHIAVVLNGTNSTDQLIYIDGQRDAISASVSQSLNTGVSQVTIGQDTMVTPSSWFNGSIDEVRISNTNRTAWEIREVYDMGLRTHAVNIEFGAYLASGNLITGSGDTSFSIDATVYGLEDLGSGLYVGEKVIVKENYDGTEYIAQGTVSAITDSTGAVTVSSWDTGSTFPSSGYTVNADVFKWQREYIPIKQRTLSYQVGTTNLLTFSITDGDEGRNIWIDDLRSTSGYLSDYTGEDLTFPSSGRYFQYKAIFNTWDSAVTPYISQVQLDYQAAGPTMDQVMRHGKWFNSSGVKQPFWWVGTH